MSRKCKRRSGCSRQGESVELLDEETLQRSPALSGGDLSDLEAEDDSLPVVLKNDRVEDHYVVGAVLGKGRFGTVFRCMCKQTEEQFAGKFIRKVGLRRVGPEEIRREVDIMNAIQSRHVISLRDGFETTEFVVLILDLATGGELFDYLAEKDALTEDEAAKFTRQILEGIDCMHEKNIVHLDLKPENIMLKDRNRSEVVVIDLGLARDLNNGEVKNICGTPEFVAPEVLNYDPITLATDMWTVGVIVYIMLSGCSPFLGDDDNETVVNVSNGHYEFYDEFFNEVSTGAKDFIKKLLRIRPKDRSSAVESLVHPWIRPKRGQRSRSRIDTARLKRFNARQKWQDVSRGVKTFIGKCCAHIRDPLICPTH